MKMKKWPKRIATWVQLWQRALRGQPPHKISYGPRPKSMVYEAVGGPYDGKLLKLVDGTTAHIRVPRDKYGAEWRGRYHCGVVASRRGGDTGTTVWKPH